ncbi:DMT family transporter [Sinorhizobium meliloti]|uniref:DMT family transporter n=1 Tax=Rhizobium meliloti TaxID=382 RepID=UPI000FD92E7D|nr:DMT family transporter [Sinorhizobium meliloti]RVK45725.1 hypothetical protein CN162_30870 [Sinorhizobium meliloti]RVM82892.1 hypothetical protein CN122_28405 [Sinorhizobium meliloti]RVN68032.1 hypothetical protein CN110_24090 [Sinorhizobium meliloti]RVO29809.1 hypothetical protein CN095_24565 [Sinorhizobium meliloti]RVP82482.1 hypothetical protein CN096_36810 [Sinorhizobium meliloti]
MSVLFLFAEIVSFSATSAIIKSIGDQVSVSTIVFLRFSFCALLFTPFILTKLLRSPIDYLGGVAMCPSYWTRAVIVVISSYLWSAAIVELPISVATAIYFTKSLFIGLLSPRLLKEETSRGHWVLLLIGLVGVAVAAAPSSDGVSPFGCALALGAAFGTALGAIQVKKISIDNDPIKINFGFVVMMSILSAPTATLNWTGPSIYEGALVVAAALLLSISLMAVVYSHRYVTIQTFAIADFGRFVAGVVIGATFFNETPDVLTLLGCSLIVLTVSAVPFLRSTYSDGDHKKMGTRR